MTSISGVEFGECFKAKQIADWDGLKVNVIDLAHLRANKQASGRLKDLADLEHLPRLKTES